MSAKSVTGYVRRVFPAFSDDDLGYRGETRFLLLLGEGEALQLGSWLVDRWRAREGFFASTLLHQPTGGGEGPRDPLAGLGPDFSLGAVRVAVRELAGRSSDEKESPWLLMVPLTDLCRRLGGASPVDVLRRLRSTQPAPCWLLACLHPDAHDERELDALLEVAHHATEVGKPEEDYAAPGEIYLRQRATGETRQPSSSSWYSAMIVDNEPLILDELTVLRNVVLPCLEAEEKLCYRLAGKEREKVSTKSALGGDHFRFG